jgi:glycine cleavage system regulatory protein
MASLVLTVIGEDHTGLVHALSETIAAHGGNWETSRMARLAGKFAGIVMVTVPDSRAEALIDDLKPLEDQGLLDITASLSTQRPPSSATRLTLELIGLDHPGIVRDISNALAGRNVNIEELDTATTSAPMDGGTLFTATATLVLPPDVSADELTQVLQDVARQLTVDIELEEAL